MRESFHKFQEILNNLKYFNLENFAILYCGFVIGEIFITKIVKAMNPRNKHTVISKGFDASNCEYQSVFIIFKMITLTCVSSYGKHASNFQWLTSFTDITNISANAATDIRSVSLIHFADVPILPIY